MVRRTKKLSVVCTSYDVELSIEEIKELFLIKDKVEEMIRLLTMTRSSFLKNIHAKHQSLDPLDYMLNRLKSSRIWRYIRNGC